MVFKVQFLIDPDHAGCASAMVSTDTDRILINCPGGTQRFCMEHRCKLSKTKAVVLTRTSCQSWSGLPGMLLTLADMGLEGMSIRGPYEVEMMKSCMAATVHRFPIRGKFLPHKAKALGVKPGPMFGQLSNGHDVTLANGQVVSSKACKEADSPPRGVLFVDAASLADLPVLKQQLERHLAAEAASNPTGTSTQIDAVVHGSDRKLQVDPHYLEACGALPLGPAVVHITPHEGLSADVRAAAGCTAHGPLLSAYEAEGADHVNGRRIQAAIMRAYPFRAAACQSMQLHEAAPDMFRLPQTLDIDAVSANPENTAAMQALRASVGADSLDKHGRIVSGLNPARGGKRKRQPVDQLCPIPASGTGGRPKLQSVAPLTAFHVTPLVIAGFDLTALPLPESAAEVRSAARTAMAQPLVEDAAAAEPAGMEGEAGGEPSALDPPLAAIQPFCAEDSFESNATAYAGAPCHHSAPELGAGQELVFLGTGSAIPSKYRSTSAIHVSLSEEEAIMLDAGEAAVLQMRICFGTGREGGSDYADCLRRLQLVWISHLHADHYLGLPRLLVERAAVTSRPAVVVGPASIGAWLSLLTALDSGLEGTYTFTDAAEYNKGASDPVLLPSGAQIKLHTVLVPHCAYAYGLALQVLPRADSEHNATQAPVSIVYSGDTQPCEQLIRLGEGCTLLVHEATFNDEMTGEARARRHATVAEAIYVGRSMQAKNIVLTHFSARYPKLSNVDGRGVTHATDFLRVNKHSLASPSLEFSSLAKLFPE